MADDPALNGPNAAAKQRPARARIRTQKIKSDNTTVGGIVLGAIDDVQLKAADYDQIVDQSVDRALRFTPRRMHSAAVINAAAQLRQDVTSNLGAYMTGRRGVVRQIATQLRGQLPAGATEMERLTAANGVLAERATGVRLEQLAALSRRQLQASENLQRFQTTVSTTFMKQSLALQYRQLYQGKDQITLMRAFADMVENKLDAIKINTKLPDTAKSAGFLRGARDLLIKEAKTQIAKHAVTAGIGYARTRVAPGLADILDADTMPTTGQAIPRVRQAINRVVDRVRQHPMGARVVGAAEAYAERMRDRMAPRRDANQPFQDAHPKQRADGADIHNIPPEELWTKSRAPRAYMAAFLRKFATPAATPVPPSVAEQAAHAAEHVSAFSTNIHNHAAGFTGAAAEHAHKLSEHAQRLGTALTLRNTMQTPDGMMALGETITAFLKSFNQYRGQFAEHGQSVIRQFGMLEGHLKEIADCVCNCACGDQPPKRIPLTPIDRIGVSHLALTGPTHRLAISGPAPTRHLTLSAPARLAIAGPAHQLAIAGPAHQLAIKGPLHKSFGADSRATLAGDIFPPEHHTGGLTRKDLHEEVAVRLDRLYDLLDHRLAAGGSATQPRSGSYEDHMLKLKASRAQNLRQRMRIARRGRGATEAALLADLEHGGHGGGGDGDHDGGGLLDDIKSAGEGWLAGKIGGRALRGVKGVGGLLRRGLGKGVAKLGLGAVAGGAAAKAAESMASETAVPAAEAVAKATAGSATKLAAEEVAKQGLKSTLKAAGKTALKRIPLVGVLAGGAFAANRAWHGDWVGAGGELASGLTSMIPGIGTAAGLAIDAGLAARDIKRRRAATATKNNTEADKVSAGSRLTTPQTALLKARLDSYGATAANTRWILALETRMAEALQGGHPIEAIDVTNFAHRFGFDVTDPKAVGYFRQWLAERALPCYKAYHDVLENHQHEITLSTDKSGQAQHVVPKVHQTELTQLLQDYKAATAGILKTAGTITPDAAIYKKLGGTVQTASLLAPTTPPPPVRQVQQAVQQTLPSTQAVSAPAIIPAAYNGAPDAARATPDNPLGLPPAQVTHPSTPTPSVTPSLLPPPARMAAAAAASNILQFRPRAGAIPPPSFPTRPSPLTTMPGRPSIPSGGSSGAGIKTANLAALPTGAVGSGQCVALVQAAAGIGNTHTWNCGAKVLGNPNIQPGTPIAVFDADGKYGNHTNGTSHAAIYLGPSRVKPGGIRVYDQWEGHPASIRDIGLSGSPVNNARYFSVIETAPAGMQQAAMQADQATPSTSGGAPAGGSGAPSPMGSMANPDTSPSSGGASAVPPPRIDTGVANPYVGAAKTEQMVFHGHAHPPSGSGVSPGSNLKPANPTSVGGPRTGFTPITTSSAPSPSGSKQSGPTTPHPTGHPYFALMYNSLYKAAVAQGCPNPAVVAQLGAAQTCLETGYGKHVPGNNAFGIKGTVSQGTTNTSTQEFVNGKMVTEKQGFRKYGSVTESAADYIKFLQTNPRYKGVLAATTVQQAISAQAKTGYATDPAYGSKLAGIVGSPGNATALAAPPGNAPVPGYTPSAGDTQAASASPSASVVKPTTTTGSSDSPVPESGSSTIGGGSPAAGAMDASATPPPPPPPSAAAVSTDRPQVGAAAGYRPPPPQPSGDDSPQPSGPTSNVVTPMQTATQEVRQHRHHALTTAQPAPPPTALPPQTPHPDMMRMLESQLAALQQVAGHGANLNKQFGTYHRDFHKINGGVQGPQGMLEQLTKGIQVAFSKQPQVTMPVVQQAIHAPHKDDQTNAANDLDVRKKRDQRYAM